jgi:hypothetical protein
MITYKNRYGDEYTFTLQEDGNILWEGPFEYFRIGYPNDYSVAYKKWHNDFPKTEMLSLGDFSQVVHQYDEEKQEYKYKEYLDLVTVEEDKIDMVDPSGGPYISTPMDMGLLFKELKGRIVKGFEKVEKGYLILC